MKINVDYDKLVGEVLGGCVQTAKQTLPILLKKHEDAQSILREHARRYMEAEDEYGLYPPFRDFAEALFRFAELPFHFIDTHRKPRPNDRPEKGNPKRKLEGPSSSESLTDVLHRPDIVMIHKNHMTLGEDLATIDTQQFPWSKVGSSGSFNLSC